MRVAAPNFFQGRLAQRRFLSLRSAKLIGVRMPREGLEGRKVLAHPALRDEPWVDDACPFPLSLSPGAGEGELTRGWGVFQFPWLTPWAKFFRPVRGWL